MMSEKILDAGGCQNPVQNQDAKLLPVARSAEDARVMLGALEAGTDGVVLHTQEPAQAS